MHHNARMARLSLSTGTCSLPSDARMTTRDDGQERRAPVGQLEDKARDVVVFVRTVDGFELKVQEMLWVQRGFFLLLFWLGGGGSGGGKRS